MKNIKAYLPDDTLVCILLMLPVKSLMRFRCVCRLWYRIISSASFINAQRKTTKDQYLVCTHSHFYALIPKEEFTNYSTFAFTRPIKYSILQEFINYKLLYYYTPKKLGGIEYDTVEVYGSCNGLLCLTDEDLWSDMDIILLNPVIRKAKTIPKIPVELNQDYGEAALCFGYFDDDYKVIRISSRCGTCWVGVYSLRADCWKITNCGKYERFYFNVVLSICVGGVAYFVAGNKRIVCFDLLDERIVQIPVPETFITNYRWGCWNNFIMEACGESIALMQIRDGYFEKWILKNRHATSNNAYMWENTMNVTCTQSQAPKYFPIEASCVVNSLWDNTRENDSYLCGNPEIISKVKGFENNNLTNDLVAINVHMGNLVLLNEQTLDPLLKQQTETCSTRSMLMFYRYTADCIS